MKRIGILTSGGDCGGLNGVIKGAASMALSNGASCFVIPNGYAGLYNLIEFDHLVELTESRIDKIHANLAGSEAGHSRVKIKKIDAALPANQACGLVGASNNNLANVALSSADVHGNLDEMLVIDVRGPDEFHEELGHIVGAHQITLGPDFRNRTAC